MGATCCTDVALHEELKPSGLSREQLVKVYPMLCDLEADFRHFADQDGFLDRQSLARLWIAGAEKKVGLLSLAEKSLITANSEKFHNIADIDGSGKVTYIEFQAFMRGGFEERAELHQMRDRLARAVKRNPAVLAQIIKLFNALDTNGDGFVTQQEIKDAWEGPTAETYPEFRVKRKSVSAGKRRNSPRNTIFDDSVDANVCLGHIDIMQLLEGADVNQDGQVDLWEFIAYAMGRRKSPVELLLYDISDGMSKRVSWALLGREFEAIYHSSVLVFGFEYWYGGRLFKTKPPCTQCFGHPLTESDVAPLKQSAYMPDLMSVHLGYTMATAAEFKVFMNQNLAKRYRWDNYDVIKNNCNAFSNEVVGFLTGSMIPDEVLNLPELLMATTTAAFLRPLLNRWLGGFGGNSSDGNDGMQIAEDDEDGAPVQHEVSAESADAQLAAGTFVLAGGLPGLSNGEQIVCRVIKESAQCVDLSYFDPKTEEITVRKNVAKSVIKTRLKSKELPTVPTPSSMTVASPGRKSTCSCLPCRK